MMERKRIFPFFLIIGISLALLYLVSYSLQDIGVAVPSCYANDDEGDEIETYTGHLFSRTERIGTRSEGPEYYLRLENGREIHVIKKAELWEKDPELQKMIDRKVWISGNLMDGELIYKEIKRLYG